MQVSVAQLVREATAPLGTSAVEAAAHVGGGALGRNERDEHRGDLLAVGQPCEVILVCRRVYPANTQRLAQRAGAYSFLGHTSL